jgi:HlyD family secretion protein
MLPVLLVNDNIGENKRGGRMKTAIILQSVSLLFILSCGNDSSNLHFTSVLEGTAIQVPALTGGQISKLLVDTGYQVEVGDTIAVVDTTELSLKQRQLSASMQELASQMELARIALKQAKTDLDYVKERHDRTLILYQKNTATKQTLDDASNQMQRAETQHKTAQQNMRTLSTKREQISAESKLIRKKINDAVILAPISGVISTKYFEPSEAVPSMSPVVEMIDLDVMDVKIYISEKMLSQVKYGQGAEIKVDGSDKDFKGKISWISPKAEFTPKSVLTPETRTSLVYAVNVKVVNQDGILKHGMPVEVVLGE